MGELLSFIENYGLYAVFIMVFLEYACFPVSSEIVLPFCGAVAVGAGHPLWLLLVITTVAGVMGATVCYLIGYFGGNRLIGAMTRRFPKTRNAIESSRAWFGRYALPSVFFGRLIPICRTYISFIAGAARQPAVPYLLATTAGAALWNTLLAGGGYLFAEHWGLIGELYDQYKLVFIPVLIAAAGIFLFMHLEKKASLEEKGME